MTVTRKDIAEQFKVKLSSVIQIDTKQLFEVWTPSGYYLVSYYTIVGKLVDGVWRLTTQKYSVTTSKQLSQFARSHTSSFVDNLGEW